ncbi:hypothetical protein [Streptomyces sp. ST1015]|uniref:hypothetical protein n=1 Tax=unclassified Streptomyces TaxID=2593676 RepID=UPI0013A6CFD3|nr:hypothetical protein [Streptomyces sp. ST1015]QZZ26122.1 hypothetical protein A7X85_07605 [Streptomyces sp. ST1015]
MGIQGVRLACAVAVCGALLAGCTSSDGDGGSARAPSSASPTPRPTAPPTEVVDIDPARLPATSAQAAALIRQVIPDPARFGPATVRRSPYESDPTRWAVLGDDCVWHQEPLPRDVLATLTRSYEIPAAGDKGPVRLGAVVTVHRTPEQADWENAEVLEEIMRCPAQRLRSDEIITSLNDVPATPGDTGYAFAEDSLTELGDYTSADLGGPHPYIWEQTRIGQFTLAVSAKGSPGWTRPALLDLLRTPHSDMRTRLTSAIEHSTPPPSTTPKTAPR